MVSGTKGNLGFANYHGYKYYTLDTSGRDLLAFRIKARNGCDIHNMKTCGNYFYFCEYSNLSQLSTFLPSLVRHLKAARREFLGRKHIDFVTKSMCFCPKIPSFLPKRAKRKKCTGVKNFANKICKRLLKSTFFEIRVRSPSLTARKV